MPGLSVPASSERKEANKTEELKQHLMGCWMWAVPQTFTIVKPWSWADSLKEAYAQKNLWNLICSQFYFPELSL